MVKVFERYREIIPDYPCFLAALETRPPVYLRVNTLKISPGEFQEVMEGKGYQLSKVPGIDEAFEGKDVESPGGTLEYFLGYYHVQGLSSMWPAHILNPQAGERILDLCAAPGGKATHLAQLMEDQGMVIANDITYERLSILRFHIDRLGTVSVFTSRYRGENFPLRVRFDRILLDPPCSAEGTYRGGGSPGNPEAVRRLSRRQGMLLERAIALLRPGGTLVYSTCTYAPEENELVIEKPLKQGLVELLPIQLPISYFPGLTEWAGKRLHPDLSKAVRLYPHFTNSWGFFIAHLRKCC